MNLAANDLTVGFDKAVAEKIQFNISAGKILAIAGPNGAGKSTLIKSLARLISPLGGNIELGGRDIWSLSAREFAQQVAYVPQLQEFEQDLTVQELVNLGRNPHQPWWSWNASAEDREAVKDALKKTSTWELRRKYLGNLSGGERQRALVATALAQRPQFMLLDEPISHLDFRHQLELIELLDTLRKQGLGIVVVLHDLNVISKLADSVLLLDKSQGEASLVVAYGDVEKVLQPTLLKQVFQVDVRRIADTTAGSEIFVTSL